MLVVQQGHMSSLALEISYMAGIVTNTCVCSVLFKKRIYTVFCYLHIFVHENLLW